MTLILALALTLTVTKASAPPPPSPPAQPTPPPMAYRLALSDEPRSTGTVNHPDACPPQWLPVLLASGSDHDHSPAPQLDDQGLPFKGNDEALSMKQPLPPTPTPRRAMAPCLDPAAHWQCAILCHRIAGQCTRECTAKHRVEKNKRKNKKCKKRCDQAKTTCKAACIRCNETPPPVVAIATSLAVTPEAGHTDSTAALIGGGAIAVALLAFLCFASRCVPPAPAYTPCVSQTLLARSPTASGHS